MGVHLGSRRIMVLVCLIIGWVIRRYPERSRRSSLVFEYTRLKWLYWMNFCFIHANYPAVYRDLRYWWESFSIAYLVESNYPELPLDDQMAIRKAWEEKDTGAGKQ